MVAVFPHQNEQDRNTRINVTNHRCKNPQKRTRDRDHKILSRQPAPTRNQKPSSPTHSVFPTHKVLHPYRMRLSTPKKNSAPHRTWFWPQPIHCSQADPITEAEPPTPHTPWDQPSTRTCYIGTTHTSKCTPTIQHHATPNHHPESNPNNTRENQKRLAKKRQENW